MINAINSLFKLAIVLLCFATFSQYSKPQPVKVTLIADSTVTPVVSALSPETEFQIDHLSRIAISEALNQGSDGMAYVIQCVLDRVESSKFDESTPFDVISAPGQFDSYNNSYYRFSRKSFKTKQSYKDAVREARRLAYEMYVNNYRPFPYGNILFFLNPKIATDIRFKRWCNANYYKVTLKDHDFYYEKLNV
jgi:hypothetical protein